MKKTQKIITILMLIAILTMSLFISKVYAVDAVVASPGTITVTKNVNNVTNPVTNTFGYTITADSNYNPASVTGYPTTASIAFSNAAPTSGTVTNTATLDFSSAVFTKVGDYRFKIEETSSTDASKYPKDNSYYYLYVSVRFDADDTNGTKMTATVAGSGIKDSDQTNGSKVPVVFETEPNFTNISITKTVTGNMGDKSEYFDVTVTVPGDTGATYAVTGSSHGDNPSTIRAGTATTLKIKHGETITIGSSSGTNQIPVGASYTIAETAVQGYITTIDTVEQSTVTKTTVQAPASNATAIVNNYEAGVLTGVFLNIMPYIVIAVAVIILIAMVKRSSKNKKED